MGLRDDWRAMGSSVRILFAVALLLGVTSIVCMVAGMPILVATSLNAIAVIFLGAAIFVSSRQRSEDQRP